MYAGGNVLFEPGGILTLSLDCTQEDGEEVATNTQQLRDAVRARQKTLKGHAHGTVVGPNIQLTTLLVARDAWPDVEALLADPKQPMQTRMRDMVEAALSPDGALTFVFPQEALPDDPDLYPPVDAVNPLPLYTFDVERSTPYAAAKWSVRMTGAPWGVNDTDAVHVCEAALVAALTAALHQRMPEKYPPGSHLHLHTDELRNLNYVYERDDAEESGVSGTLRLDQEGGVLRPSFLRPARRWFETLRAQSEGEAVMYPQVVCPIIEMGAIEATRVGYLPNEAKEIQRTKGKFRLSWLEPLRAEVTALMRGDDLETPFPESVTFQREQLLAALAIAPRAHPDPPPPEERAPR